MSYISSGHHGDRPPDSRATYASMAKGKDPILKKFTDIKEAAKKERNVIEIRFRKQRSNDE